MDRGSFVRGAFLLLPLYLCSCSASVPLLAWSNTYVRGALFGVHHEKNLFLLERGVLFQVFGGPFACNKLFLGGKGVLNRGSTLFLYFITHFTFLPYFRGIFSKVSADDLSDTYWLLRQKSGELSKLDFILVFASGKVNEK